MHTNIHVALTQAQKKEETSAGAANKKDGQDA
jgi:hypothetical protein